MSSTSSSLPKLPTTRPISWLATIPQLVALSTAIAIGWLVSRDSAGIFLGTAAYLTYSIGSRQLIPRAHRRGIRLSQNREFEAAIREHKASYEFFSRHPWLDRYRSIVMMSPSAMSYREMALLNIAFAYGQLGEGAKSKEYYLRAKEEFPENGLADAALKMIESFEHPQND